MRLLLGAIIVACCSSALVAASAVVDGKSSAKEVPPGAASSARTSRRPYADRMASQCAEVEKQASWTGCVAAGDLLRADDIDDVLLEDGEIDDDLDDDQPGAFARAAVWHEDLARRCFCARSRATPAGGFLQRVFRPPKTSA